MTIGVAVIGAGMAGRAHAAAYRMAPSLYESILPDLRFVSIGDISPELGSLATRRFGYERADTRWQAIAEDPDINAVSVVVANSLHREIVEGLVEAGKHVLCEKPLSDNLEDARAMADIAPRCRDSGPHRLYHAPGARRCGHPRTHRVWDAGSRPARRRPVLVRLRVRSDGPDQLAIQGSSRVRRARRHREPRRVSHRVSGRGCAGGQWRPIHDGDQGAAGAARHRRRPWSRRVERHLRTSGERRLRQLQRPP